MYTLDELMGDPSLTRDGFAKRHPYPFLVLTPFPGELAPGGTITETKQVDELDIEEMAQRIMKLRESGVQLRPGPLGTLVFPVCKYDHGREGNTVRLGRAPDCDIIVSDRRLSKIHAYFEYDTGTETCRVTDAGSRNGTRVNGRLIEQGEWEELRTGHQLQLGPIILVFTEARQLYTRIRTQEIPKTKDTTNDDQ